MNQEEKTKILGKQPTELFCRLDDFSYSTDVKDRVLSGIYELDYLTKGFEMGCTTIWTGLTNAGKTTVMTMIAKNTIEQGHQIFFFNGEQTKEDFKNNLYIQSCTKEDLIQKQYKDSCVFDTFIKKESKVNELNKRYGQNIYVYNNESKRDINTLIYAMNYLNKTQKIKVFFLDNFMQIDVKSDNVFQEQTDIMEKLRTFAVNNKVHIHLVAHPKKVDRGQTRLNVFDVLGSSNLINKAYNIISIMRVDNITLDSERKAIKNALLKHNYDIEQCDSALEVLKTKGTGCGIVGLEYNKDIKSYKEAYKLTQTEKEILLRRTEEKEGNEKCPF